MIHKESHSYDRIGAVFFAFAVFAKFISLFNLKVIIRAVVIKQVFTAFQYLLAVFVKLSLDEIAVGSKNGERTVYILELEVRFLKEIF